MKTEYETNLKGLIRQSVNDELGDFKTTVMDYIKADTEWKKTAQPYINIATEGKGFLSFGKYIIIGLTSMGAFIVTIVEAIHLIWKTR